MAHYDPEPIRLINTQSALVQQAFFSPTWATREASKHWSHVMLSCLMMQQQQHNVSSSFGNISIK